MIPKWIRKDLLYHWPTKEYFESILTVVEDDDNTQKQNAQPTEQKMPEVSEEELEAALNAFGAMFGGGDPNAILKNLGLSDDEIKSIMTEQEPSINKVVPCEGSVVQIEDIREQYQKENK